MANLPEGSVMFKSKTFRVWSSLSLYKSSSQNLNQERDKGYAWHTAIGLQAVEGSIPSEYLVKMAI
jgi:hypothetical protein